MGNLECTTTRLKNQRTLGRGRLVYDDKASKT